MSLDRFYNFFIFFLSDFDGSCKTCKKPLFLFNNKNRAYEMSFSDIFNILYVLGTFGGIWSTPSKDGQPKIIYVKGYCGKTVVARKNLVESKLFRITSAFF